jgi:TPR repeat protein
MSQKANYCLLVLCVAVVAVVAALFNLHQIKKQQVQSNPFGGVGFLRTPENNSINLSNIFSKYDPEICREIMPYFEKSEKLGDTAAKLYLGVAYMANYQDADKAASYLGKCHKLFDLDIIEYTFSASFSGDCDAIEINRYNDSAAALGFAPSYYRIPYSKSTPPQRFFSFRCNKKKFLLHLKLYNSAPAECLLGMIYQNESVFDLAVFVKNVNLSQLNQLAGTSNEDDSKEAMKYFNASAARGFVPAMLLLAYSFQHGIGVDKDSAKAEEWLKRAAALRSRDN